MSEADDVGAQQRYRYQHERREDEFDDFDGDDANVLDGILRVFASLADEARAKVNAFYENICENTQIDVLSECFWTFCLRS